MYHTWFMNKSDGKTALPIDMWSSMIDQLRATIIIQSSIFEKRSLELVRCLSTIDD